MSIYTWPLPSWSGVSDLNTLKELLRYGANVNAVDGELESALFWSVAGNDLDAVNILLEQKDIDVNIEERANEPTALYQAVKDKNIPIVRRLISHGANISHVFFDKPIKELKEITNL